MIDTHIHILPGVDDGSKDLESTMKMVKEEESCGFNKIISTSHFIEYSNELNSNTINSCVQKLNDEIKKNGISVKIYSGSEIYYTPNILKLLKEKKVATYCDTNYYLMELPIIGRPSGYIEIIEETINNGYIPIIAHPERYEWFEKKYDEFKKLRNMGVKFQVNFGSILKQYGSKPQKNIIKLLKDDMVDLIGTDSHRYGKISTDIDKSIAKIKKICGEKKFEILTSTNPQSIIDKKEI